jgi:hypothetical protein
LARCYERQGRLSAALRLYERLALTTGSLYRQDAQERIVALRQRSDLAIRSEVNGVLTQANSLPSSDKLESWMSGLAGAGITTLILDTCVGQRSTSPGRSLAYPVGVYFRTTLAPMLRDVLGELTAIAHRHGILVFSTACLDRMDWIEPDLGWNDTHYDTARRTVAPSSHLDLFNPAFREYLNGLLTDLAQSGVDGIVFRFGSQPTEGFSRYAADAFEREFQIRLDPTTVLRPAAPDAGARNGSGASMSPEYWRWVGWKMRERMKLLESFMQSLRRKMPALQFALEMHAESVTDPVTALVQYSEDLLDVRRSSVQFVLIPVSASPQASNTHGGKQNSLALLVARARDLLAGLDRLWIIRGGDGHVSRATLPPEVGVISDERR